MNIPIKYSILEIIASSYMEEVHLSLAVKAGYRMFGEVSSLGK